MDHRFEVTNFTRGHVCVGAGFVCGSTWLTIHVRPALVKLRLVTGYEVEGGSRCRSSSRQTTSPAAGRGALRCCPAKNLPSIAPDGGSGSRVRRRSSLGAEGA